jgi:hypothetical protein
MIAEVCPTCEGWCCRDGSEMHVTHRPSRYTRHVCPDCDAGLAWTAYTEPAPKPVRTAEDERKAIVAWLRDFGSGAWLENGGLSLVNLDEIADLFERGEHLKEKP